MKNDDTMTPIKRLILASDDDPWRVESSRSLSWRLIQRSHAWRPPTDVLETEDGYVVVVDIAGMRGAEFAVTFERQMLSIRGVRTDSHARKTYHQMEIDYGEFATEMEIPVQVDESQVDATYGDGFLRVYLPKAQAKSISITDKTD